MLSSGLGIRLRGWTMRPQPDPRVIDDLCKKYRHATRDDITACWQNASLHWFEVPPEVLTDEPGELRAARALFVHSQLERNREEAAWYSFCMWTLVSAYIKR
jgi:hypothetical protein